MKNIKYIILAMAMVSLAFGNLTGLLAQKSKIGFLETYTVSEISGRLEPGDPFFTMIRKNTMDQESSLIGYCTADKKEQVSEYIHSNVFKEKLPEDAVLLWGAQQQEEGLPLYAIRKSGKAATGLDGSDIQRVEVAGDNGDSRPALLISFNSDGAKKWASQTGLNVGRDIAIVIDNRVWSAPRVREQINMGKCMITGNFTSEEMTALRDRLDPRL